MVILNPAEQGVGQTLIRVSTGVPGDGQTVTRTRGGNDYPATVDAQGNWTLNLTPAQVQTLDEGINTLVVNASDAAGNSGLLTMLLLLISHRRIERQPHWRR